MMYQSIMLMLFQSSTSMLYQSNLSMLYQGNMSMLYQSNMSMLYQNRISSLSHSRKRNTVPGQGMKTIRPSKYWDISSKTTQDADKIAANNRNTRAA